MIKLRYRSRVLMAIQRRFRRLFRRIRLVQVQRIPLDELRDIDYAGYIDLHRRIK